MAHCDMPVESGPTFLLPQLQISSSMARAMETIDMGRIARTVYPWILNAKRRGLDAGSIENIVATASEGYAFPSNLDRDPPVGGLTPPSQTDILRRAVDEESTSERLDDELASHAGKRSSLDPW